MRQEIGEVVSRSESIQRLMTALGRFAGRESDGVEFGLQAAVGIQPGEGEGVQV